MEVVALARASLAMNILVLNAGSSSLKFQLIATDSDRIRMDQDQRLLRGEFESIGGEAVITLQQGRQPRQRLTAPIPGIPDALKFLVCWMIEQAGLPQISSSADIHAVGHRVVHGGERFTESVLVTEQVVKGLDECANLAPLHNPINIAGIRAAREIFGTDVPQVAVFDTAFHHTLPEHAYLYAIPYDLYSHHHIRRYGFHGTSHRYVTGRYRKICGLTSEQTHVVSLHLGNGCSAAAIRGGRSVDTSMGMTPLEGLVMGTRSGDLDPALVSILADKLAIPVSEVDTLLNSQSGLLGISGISGDMRALLEEMNQHANPRARLAIEIFCYRVRKYVGAFVAAMGGADAIIFTGGIGENAPEIRARICQGLEWMGLSLDAAKNLENVDRERLVSQPTSRLAVYVIPTDEELLIARDTATCVEGQQLASTYAITP